MFPYVLLIVLSLLFSYVARTSGSKRKGKISAGKWVIGTSEYVNDNNVSLSVFFFTLFLILSLRDISIGRDLANYKYYFKEYTVMSYETLFNIEGDILYILFNWLIGKITKNYQIFLSVVAAMTLIPVYKQYAKDRRYSFLKVILFMNMSVFIMFFSGLRQSLAIAVGMIAYEFVKSKRIVPFLFTVAIAIGFHHSAFVLLLMYPLYHLRLKKIHLVVIVPITAMVFVFNREIFGVLSGILYRMSGGKYEAVASSTGAYTMIILLALFLALSYFVPDEAIMDDETFGLRNYLIFALWLQCLAPLHNLVMRFNYYYIIFVPMVIPKVLACSSLKYRKIAKLAEIVITVYLLYYYTEHTYRACITGISALDTYPYVPFWSE